MHLEYSLFAFTVTPAIHFYILVSGECLVCANHSLKMRVIQILYKTNKKIQGNQKVAQNKRLTLLHIHIHEHFTKNKVT